MQENKAPDNDMLRKHNALSQDPNKVPGVAQGTSSLACSTAFDVRWSQEFHNLASPRCNNASKFRLVR